MSHDLPGLFDARLEAPPQQPGCVNAVGVPLPGGDPGDRCPAVDRDVAQVVGQPKGRFGDREPTAREGASVANHVGRAARDELRGREGRLPMVCAPIDAAQVGLERGLQHASRRQLATGPPRVADAVASSPDYRRQTASNPSTC